jgi:hypothetical protein
MAFSQTITDVVDEATGRSHRADPVLPATGGPAGNARLTAWTGLVLLVLIAVELVTLLDVRGLISWHIVVGTLLVPFALLKTAATTWRIGRYYSGHPPYRSAGPPPMLLRILGPLVVITTLAELGTGLALVALGPDSGRRVLFTALGQGIDVLTLHQAFFFAFATATGLHILGRAVPALKQVAGRLDRASATGGGGVPGRSGRVAAVLLTLVAAAVTAALILGASSGWKNDRRDHFTGRSGVGTSGPSQH